MATAGIALQIIGLLIWVVATGNFLFAFMRRRAEYRNVVDAWIRSAGVLSYSGIGAAMIVCGAVLSRQ